MKKPRPPIAKVTVRLHAEDFRRLKIRAAMTGKTLQEILTEALGALPVVK
jgi:predicted DNA binding CopG/RHH family protein